MNTCEFLASKGFHFQNIEVGVTEKRFTHVFIAQFIEISFLFWILNSVRSRSVVNDLEARCVVLKIPEKIFSEDLTLGG